MTRFLSMKRLTILFFSVFAVMTAGTLAFQHFWISPGDKCTGDGKWYDMETRICATPIYIPDITGRPAGTTRAEASAAKNTELIGLEAQVAQERAARRAAIDQQRQELKAKIGG